MGYPIANYGKQSGVGGVCVWGGGGGGEGGERVDLDH